MSTPLTIWCNAHYAGPVMDELRRGLGPHRLVQPAVRSASNLVPASADPLLAEADVALGQPDPQQVLATPRLRWVHLTTAGYTRYDTDAFRAAMKSRGSILTNSSSVYDEPCAEHLLAMMLAVSRQLPQCWADQSTTRSWRAAEHRIRCHLLENQTALLLGFGAIARRLVELLAPFKMNLVAVRRTVTGDEPIRTLPFSRLRELVPAADHVLNILPANASTERMFDADQIALMKPTATFYNIGRGTTVDQPALQRALERGAIAGAYLDVTDPEPHPPHHPLWRLPNCRITPHAAGGHADEFERIVRHFLDNLRRFETGKELADRIV
jgi:phosphoglycerate dehydrogenase-like enzyme